MDRENLRDLFLIFVLVTGILFANRYFYHFLPSNDYIILADHLFAGFIIPLGFYMAFLGGSLFFNPKIRVTYNYKYYSIAVFCALLILFIWEGFVQKFQNLDQVIIELVGIIFSIVYFIVFRRSL